MDDLISRQAAIDAIADIEQMYVIEDGHDNLLRFARTKIWALPSAQPERDIPKKPTETTDRTWGIPCKQAVCPNCDYYLGMVHFLGEGKKKVTFCETCGQAIDWSEWEVEHE